MEFNKLEQKFFEKVLNAELDVPVRALLEFETKSFEIIVVPKVTTDGDLDGYFVLHFFGAPACKLQPGQSLSIEELFVHPALRQASIDRTPVSLQLNGSSLFFDKPSPKLDARVLSAKPRGRGSLVLIKNQVAVQTVPLKKAEFSLVDFPNFMVTEHLLSPVLQKGELEAFHKDLKSASARLEDDAAEIKITKPHRTVLDTGDGWAITLTKDEEQTRGYVSHSGLIKKSNDEEFNIDDLNDVLEGLNQFFAFTACAYRHPTAVIGYNADNRAIWGQVGKFKLMRRSSGNWFLHSGTLPENIYLEYLFPRFWRKWKEQRDEVTTIVEYYVNSKAAMDGLPKEAVAISYAGLEVLASLILENPDKNNSLANVTKALKCYGIPNRCLKESKTPITTQLSQDLDVGKSGPDLIHSVRNYVAHPLDRAKYTIKKRHLKYLDANYSPYIYLHDLSQFYLEYLFLKGLCGYKPEDFRPLIETLNTASTKVPRGDVTNHLRR